MSKSFNDKLLKSTYNGKYHSKFGASILSKYGWKEGKGLGKLEDGNVDIISLNTVTDNSGIMYTEKKNDEWNNWWDDMYNNLASKINVTTKDTDTNIKVNKKKKIKRKMN